MNEITNKIARTSTSTNNKNNNASFVSPSEAAPAPELLLGRSAAAVQQQLLFSPPPFYYLSESDMRTILLSSCSDNHCSNNTNHQGLELLADHCLHAVHKETFLRAVCGTGLGGVAQIILRHSNSPTRNDSNKHSNQDHYGVQRIVRAGCVVASCFAVCARYKNFCQACHPTAATLLQAVLQALRRFPHHPDIQRFGMATVSRMVKSTATRELVATNWHSDDNNSSSSSSSVSVLLEDPIVAALQTNRDNDDDDDDDLWLVLWACQAVKRMARHNNNNNNIAEVMPVRMARRIKPLLHAILLRYNNNDNNNNNNNSTGTSELQGMILKETWSALKHLQKLTA